MHGRRESFAAVFKGHHLSCLLGALSQQQSISNDSCMKACINSPLEGHLLWDFASTVPGTARSSLVCFDFIQAHVGGWAEGSYLAVTAAGSCVALPAVGSCRPGFTGSTAAAAADPGSVTVGCRVPEPAPAHMHSTINTLHAHCDSTIGLPNAQTSFLIPQKAGRFQLSGSRREAPCSLSLFLTDTSCHVTSEHLQVLMRQYTTS